MNSKKYGVIFDLDGTIWDSIDYRVKAWRNAFKDYNMEADPEIIRLMIGYPGSMLIKAVHGKNPDIEKREEEYFGDYIKDVKFFPDVLETFKELRDNNIKIAIVTSSRRGMINKLKINADAIVTMDDVNNGKPDPEPYLKALKIMNIDPENAIVVGDIDNDLIPAKKLGCTAVIVTHGLKKEAPHKDFEIKEIKDLIKIIKNKFNLSI